MVSGTGLVVMVSGTGTDGVSVPVSIIETWRFPSLGFCFLVLTQPPPTIRHGHQLGRIRDLDAACSMSALHPAATE